MSGVAIALVAFGGLCLFCTIVMLLICAGAKPSTRVRMNP